MRKTFILATLLFSSVFAFSQKRTFPKTKNQITKQDAISDEFGREYTEEEYYVIEMDTVGDHDYFLMLDKKSKENNVTDPDRDIPEIDMDSIFYMNSKKTEQPVEKKTEKKQPAATTKKK